MSTARARWAAIAACVIALSACGRDGTNEEPRSYRLELGAGAPSRSSGATALAAGKLAPGRYVTPNFAPRLAFTVGDGWELGTENKSIMALYRGPNSMSLLAITVLDDMLVPEALQSREEEGSYDSDLGEGGDPSELSYATGPAPRDFIEYLDSLDHVDVGPRTPITIGGWTGEQADGRTQDLSARPGVCGAEPGPCFIAIVQPGPVPIEYGEYAPGRFRSAVLQGPGGPLGIHLSAPDDESFVELAVAADALLASLTIGAGQ